MVTSFETNGSGIVDRYEAAAYDRDEFFLVNRGEFGDDLDKWPDDVKEILTEKSEKLADIVTEFYVKIDFLPQNEVDTFRKFMVDRIFWFKEQVHLDH